MSHVSKTPFDLTLHLVSTGGNSDGGWIPGNGYPNPQVGRIGQRYVDVQTGHIYGPKTRGGWPAEYTHTLNLGNVVGEFANMMSRVPALEVRTSNLEARTTLLEGRADSAADLAIQQQVTLQEHGLRIETLEADSLEVRRRLGMVDSSLTSRMQAAEDALNDLNHLRGLDFASLNSRLDILSTELNGNGSSLTHLQQSYTSMSQTWTQEVTTLRSEFNGNVATLQETLRTHANRHSATAELITELTAQVGDNSAAITTESLTRATEFSALAQQISRLSAETATTSANLTSRQTAMANDLEAYASSVLALNAQIGENSVSFQEEIQTLADADQALARRVSTLDAASEELSGRITSEESARISGDSVVLISARDMVATSEAGTAVKIAEESAARLSGDQAEAYQRSLLETKFTNQGADLSAAISAESSARASAIAAETTERNKQISEIKDDIGDVSAAITAESATRASAISAETTARNQQISTVNTKVDQVSTTVGGIQTQVTNLSAAITSESKTRADAIAAETSARNQQVSTLNTSIGQVSSAVTQEATTRATVDGYLGGRYTLSVSTSGGGYQSVAGMEIASTSLAGRQATNHIAFFADRFYITHSASGVAEAPFMVEGGRVYIKSAVIQDAAISTLKIAGNAVTVPTVVSTDGSAPSAGIYMDQPGHVLVICTVNFISKKGAASTVGLSINGQGQVNVSVPNDYSTNLTTCFGFDVSAGYHTFTGNPSYAVDRFNIGRSSIVLMGAKR